MERLEDRIAEAVNRAPHEYDKHRCYKYAEFEYGGISGDITIEFDWHSVEDWQIFDWGRTLVQSEDVIDGIASLDVECWDNATGERVIVDHDYLTGRVDV